MRRRSFLAAAGAALVGLAGCAALGNDSNGPTTTPRETTTGTTTSTPVQRVDLPECETTDRPTGVNGSFDPRPYPERPASLATHAAAIEYVVAYEEAYVYNRLLEGSGENLRSASVHASGVRAVDGPDGSTLVLVETTTRYEVERNGSVVAGDGWDVPYVYFVNGTTVVRARASGAGEWGERVEADPLSDGTVLECAG